MKIKKIITLLTLFAMLGSSSLYAAYKPQVDQSQAYVTTANLGISGNYDSGVLSLEDYTQVQTHVFSDQDGTITVEFCADAGGTDVVRTLTIPYAAANGFQLFAAPAFSPYVRYQFDNGAVAQTDFFFETKFLTKSLSGQLLGVEGFVSPTMIATLGRSVTVGQDPEGNYVNLKSDGIAFRTETPLGISGVYTSPVTALEGYSQIETHLYADEAGSLTGRWYNDAAKTTLLREFTRPYSGDEVGTISYFSSPVFGPYLEYTYTNGSTGQTEFFLDFHPRTKAISGQVLGMNDFIPSGVVANLGRNVLVGQDSTGSFRNVPTDTEGHLKVNINDPITAFGDLRVAELTPQVHLTFPYSINDDIVTTNRANGGTIVSESSMAKLSTSTATTGSATMSSRNVVNYRSGLGTLARYTGRFTTGVAGADQIIGIGDAEDGFFFGFNGTSFGVMIRKDGTDTWTPQTSWNVDIMDGNDGLANPSNMNLTNINLNVFQIKFQWLGAGQIEFAIEDPNTGQFVPVHRVKYANNFQEPSIFNPSLTMYAQVVKTSGATDIVMHTASMSGFTEGKSIVTGPINTYTRTETISENTVNAFFVLQNKATYLTKTNKVRVKPVRMSVGNSLNGIVNVKVYVNQTISNTPTYADVNGDNSVIEVATDHTPTAATGKLVFVGSVGPTSGSNFTFDNFAYTLVPGEYLTVEADIPDAAGNPGSAELSVSITWQEDF